MSLPVCFFMSLLVNNVLCNVRACLYLMVHVSRLIDFLQIIFILHPCFKPYVFLQFFVVIGYPFNKYPWPDWNYRQQFKIRPSLLIFGVDMRNGLSLNFECDSNVCNQFIIIASVRTMSVFCELFTQT